MVWCSTNGLRSIVSASGRAKVLSGRTAARPSPGSPAQQTAMAAIGPTVHVLRQVGHCRSPTQNQETAEFIRRNSGDLPELLHDRARLPHWIDHHAAQRLRAVPARLALE